LWREGGAAALLLAAAGCAWWFGGDLELAQQVVLGAVLLLGLGVVLRRGWLRLFGPVLFYELVRTARRSRYVALRSLYACLLLLVLLSVYLSFKGQLAPSGGGLNSPAMARFAASFFYTFMTVQFAAALLLTPAYVAGAVAEEKDRGTLEFLLATDLRGREIVLGKLAAHLGNLGLLILTGLPILSLTQFWGGVDPGLVLAGFAATGLTLASVAGLSMLVSVYARKTREAIVLTYLAVVAYLGLSGLSLALLSYPDLAKLALSPGAKPLTAGDLIRGFNAGNLLVVLQQLREQVAAAKPLATVVPGLLRDYALFHGLVTVTCVAWAVLRLRAVAVGQAPLKATPRARRAWHRLLPPVGRAPMVWKEVFAEPGLSFNRFGRAIIGLIVVVSFAPALWIGFEWLVAFVDPGYEPSKTLQALGGAFRLGSWAGMARLINVWVRVVGTLVACLTLLGVAVRAAGSVSGERDRQTLDGLLSSPLTVNAILYAKWLGSLLGVRWAWLWLCLIWGLGLVTGGLHVFTVPWLVLAWAVYASFLAALGMWFSVISRTTLRATLATLAATAVLGGGHRLLAMMCLLPVTAEPFAFQLYGLTPPVSFAWLSFHGDEFELNLFRDVAGPVEAFNGIIAGLVLWAVAALILWVLARQRFRTAAGRRPFRRGPAPSPLLPLKPLPPPQALPEIEQPVAERPLPAKSRGGKAVGRRRRKRLVHWLALPLLPALAWYAYLAFAAEREWRQAVAEADRVDPGWRWEELQARRAVVPPARDAAPTVMIVHQAVISRSPGPPFHRGDPPQRPDRRWIARASAELTKVAPGLALAAPLDHLPGGCYPLALAVNPVTTPCPHLDAVALVSGWLQLDTFCQADKEDPDQALAAWLRLLNVARSIGDEPLFVSQVVRSQRVQEASSVLERVLAQGQPGEAPLATVQALLEDEDAEPSQLIAARGERAYLDKVMQALQAGDMPWSELESFIGLPAEESGRGAREEFKRSVAPGYLKKERAALLKFMTKEVEIAKLPFAAQPPQIRALYRRFPRSLIP
jgi:ABC-type transport system involved in multi-copper enzyme maturation permease subunit